VEITSVFVLSRKEKSDKIGILVGKCMKKKLKLVGTFRNTERGYGFIEIEAEEKKEDVFVAPKFCKDALNGDEVEFVIVNSANRRKKSRRQNYKSP